MPAGTQTCEFRIAKEDVVIYSLLIIALQVSQKYLYGFFRETGTTYILEHDP